MLNSKEEQGSPGKTGGGGNIGLHCSDKLHQVAAGGPTNPLQDTRGHRNCMYCVELDQSAMTTMGGISNDDISLSFKMPLDYKLHNHKEVRLCHT
jgi:hypothetical protein